MTCALILASGVDREQKICGDPLQVRIVIPVFDFRALTR